MELRALKYFQSVYEQGSISAAARCCFVSQPSITSAIQLLESDLNITLFVRHARGVLPTGGSPFDWIVSDFQEPIINLVTRERNRQSTENY